MRADLPPYTPGVCSVGQLVPWGQVRAITDPTVNNCAFTKVTVSFSPCSLCV